MWYCTTVKSWSKRNSLNNVTQRRTNIHLPFGEYDVGGRSKGTGKPEEDEEETGNGFLWTGNVFMFWKETSTVLCNIYYTALHVCSALTFCVLSLQRLKAGRGLPARTNAPSPECCSSPVRPKLLWTGWHWDTHRTHKFAFFFPWMHCTHSFTGSLVQGKENDATPLSRKEEGNGSFQCWFLCWLDTCLVQHQEVEDSWADLQSAES